MMTRFPANAAPEQLPLAVLRNGAYLWTVEEVASVCNPCFNIVARPRAAREAEIEAEQAAMARFYEAEQARAAAEPTVVREGVTRGRTQGFSFKACYTELSDGTFKAVVEDKLGNVLFPCSGKMEHLDYNLRESVSGWLENAE